MSLRQQLDAFKAAFEPGGPPYNASRERIEIMHRATEELRRSGLAERALNVDDLAPAFELDNQDGQLVERRLQAGHTGRSRVRATSAGGATTQTSPRNRPDEP
jgi:hypothetical protein